MYLNIPKSLNAGDTWNFSVNIPDYPSSLWQFFIILRGPGEIDNISSTTADDTKSFNVSVPYATTELFVPGLYAYQAFVTNGTERFTVGTGDIKITPNILNLTTHETRSHNKIMLDALEEFMQKKALGKDFDMKEYNINGIQASKMTIAELKYERDKYKRLVMAEEGLLKTVRKAYLS